MVCTTSEPPFPSRPGRPHVSRLWQNYFDPTTGDPVVEKEICRLDTEPECLVLDLITRYVQGELDGLDHGPVAFGLHVIRTPLTPVTFGMIHALVDGDGSFENQGILLGLRLYTAKTRRVPWVDQLVARQRLRSWI
jgi:hypothetical protein